MTIYDVIKSTCGNRYLSVSNETLSLPERERNDVYLDTSRVE